MSISAGRNFISENAYEDVISQMKDLSVEARGKGTSKKELDCQRSLFYDIMECIEWMKMLVLKVLKRQLFLLYMSHLLPMLSLQLHKIVPLFLLHMVTATYPLMQLSSMTIFSLEFTTEDPTRWRDFMALGKMRRPLRCDGIMKFLGYEMWLLLKF
ncbi:uncharacterized protein LOC131217478 [Magnolia sinica]|uniref:uncharacterized protein LOC131217478 n=1 Tax=Magnolia sinica TaxID=86752 RepID=UPI00265A5873|nr:uncharacterized protein LOC131217478 [Magnolia sinica]